MTDQYSQGEYRDDSGALVVVGKNGTPVGVSRASQAGMYAPSTIVGGGSGVVTASRTHLARFVPERSMTIKKIAFLVSVAAGADDTIDVGIYDSSLNRIVSKGSTTGQVNSTGVKEITIADTPLVAGTVYYAAFAIGAFGGTAAQFLLANMGPGGSADLFGAALPTAELAWKAAAPPLPASIALPPSFGIGAVPQLALKES